MGKDSARNELLKHLYKDNLPLLFRDEASQLTDYGELTRHTYQVIARALKEEADQIQASDLSLAWSREGKIIDKINHSPSPDPKYPISFRDQLQKIIVKDPIMKKWTRVVSDEGESILCEFLSQ